MKDQLFTIWNLGLNLLDNTKPPSSSSIPLPKMNRDSIGKSDGKSEIKEKSESGTIVPIPRFSNFLSTFGFAKCQRPIKPPENGSHCTSQECYESTSHGIGSLPPFDTSPLSSPLQIQIIEWHMLDKWKFVPLSMASSFTIRSLLYPFTVIKTCIQLQHKNTVYSSMLDAFKKIKAAEGYSGLYKGFWVSAFQIISGVCYVSTYEGVRHILYENHIHGSNLRAIIAGGCASVVGQTFIVPFDVISQHLMVLGQSTTKDPSKAVLNPLNVRYEGRTKFQITSDITKEIYARDGLRGYYRGYFASLGCYVPNSALWWGFYHMYQDEIGKIVPENTSLLVVQCMSAISGGFTTTILTNPLDVCRARLQVQRLDSFPKTFTLLCHEEGLRIFTKGLSARITQSAVFSFSIILGYETIKRFSVNEEYRSRVRW